MDSVVVILDGLESEGEVLHEEGTISLVDIEFGSLDGRSSQNIHRAANRDLSIFCSLEELDADCVLRSYHSDIEVFLQVGATRDI